MEGKKNEILTGRYFKRTFKSKGLKGLNSTVAKKALRKSLRGDKVISVKL